MDIFVKYSIVFFFHLTVIGSIAHAGSEGAPIAYAEPNWGKSQTGFELISSTKNADGSALIQWTAADEFTVNYEIFHAPTETGPWTNVINTNPMPGFDAKYFSRSTLSFTDHTLPVNTQPYYRIRAASMIDNELWWFSTSTKRLVLSNAVFPSYFAVRVQDVINLPIIATLPLRFICADDDISLTTQQAIAARGIGTSLIEATAGLKMSVWRSNGGGGYVFYWEETDPLKMIQLRNKIINDHALSFDVGFLLPGYYYIIKLCDPNVLGSCNSVNNSNGSLGPLRNFYEWNFNWVHFFNDLANPWQPGFGWIVVQASNAYITWSNPVLSTPGEILYKRVDPSTESNCGPPLGPQTSSPLMVNFDERLPKLSAPYDGVGFDIDADGALERVAWPVGAETGILAWDRNLNGKIDGGQELFGNHTPDLNGKTYENGFEALSQFDSNADDRINSKDPIFHELIFWFDQNHDGVSQSNEMESLTSRNVAFIRLKYKERVIVDEFGNELRERSRMKLTTGESLRIVDAWLSIIEL